MLQDPIAGAPLLRAMSAHSVAKALQDCFVEFLIYLCNLSDSQTSVSANYFSHTCHSLLGVGGGRPAWAGVAFKASASTFET
jgi:hypothetical protein